MSLNQDQEDSPALHSNLVSPIQVKKQNNRSVFGGSIVVQREEKKTDMIIKQNSEVKRGDSSRSLL